MVSRPIVRAIADRTRVCMAKTALLTSMTAKGEEIATLKWHELWHGRCPQAYAAVGKPIAMETAGQPSEIDHAECFQASDADRYRVRTVSSGRLIGKAIPIGPEGGRTSSIPLRHLACKKRLLRQYQFENVNAAVGGEQRREMLQQIVNGVVGKMMKKTVHENEVITLGRADAVPGYIDYHKVSSKAALRLTNVRGIDIHAGVVNVGEESRVGAGRSPRRAHGERYANHYGRAREQISCA